ncbi:MAG TPA: hypothetical protein VFR43_13850 [Gaiellaceae bacterium]|nr:hypothetical protein [Gaiellaceae bacterium]
MRKLLLTTVVAIAAAAFAAPALAGTATPFGGATVADGVLVLVSNTSDGVTTNDASGVGLADTGVTTFASLTTLATEFDVTDDDCKAGSPRFQVGVQTASGVRNVFVYLGPSPSFTGCAQNTWLSTGNLIGSTDARFDTSQVEPGTQQSTYAQALQRVGTLPVTSISLVVDSGWAFDDKEQTVRARNVQVNGETFYAPKAPAPLNPAKACKQLRADMGVEAFRMRYGTNGNGANAFGKCVSAMAKLKSGAARAAAVTEIAADARACATAAGKAKGKGKGHGKAKGLTLRACVRKAG